MAQRAEVRETPILSSAQPNESVWDPVESIAFAWDAVKDSPRIVFTLLPATAAMAVPWILPTAIRLFDLDEDPYRPWWGRREEQLSNRLALFCIPIWIWLSVGVARYSLRVVRGTAAGFRDLFRPAPGAWMHVVLGTFAFGLAMAAALYAEGLALSVFRHEQPALVVWIFTAPVLVFAARLALYVWFCADRRASGLVSTWASWRATTGHTVGIVVLWAGLAFVGLLGLLACGVGVIVTTALSHIALAHAYDRLASQAARRSAAPVAHHAAGDSGPPS